MLWKSETTVGGKRWFIINDATIEDAQESCIHKDCLESYHNGAKIVKRLKNS